MGTKVWSVIAVVGVAGLGAGCGGGLVAAEAESSGIVNGDNEDGYPAVGALITALPDREPSGSFCSGTLIDPQWVLTAAHCLEGTEARVPGSVPPSESNYVHFFIGSDANDRAAGRRVPAERLFIHPNYSGPGGRAYDLALFKLQTPITDVTPIPIHRVPLEGRERTDLFYVGFGQSDSEGGGSGRKRSTTLSLFSVAPIVYITAQGLGGVCFGDSGGPGLIDVDGHFEVAGINSTVFGDPNCFQYSTQIRADAYQTWIDQIMGVSAPASCLDAPDLCGCSQACGPDGVCDSALCGRDGCNELLACLRFCQTLECSIRCLLGATPEANHLYETLTECARQQCPDGSSACLREKCRRPSTGCDEGLEAVTGPQACGEVYWCSRDCALDDLECQDACWYEGTLQAQATVDGLEACIQSQCGEAPTRQDALRCAYRACRGRFLTCLPQDECRLVGGDCGPDQACTAEPWVGTYCRQTEGASVGQPCDPSVVTCADGALCLDVGAGPVCLEVCSGVADCEQSYGPCQLAEAPGLAFSVGVCSLQCPDTDADGSCDEDDCEPRNPRVFPGAEEICDAARVDEDCDGEHNEQCMTCPDGSFALECPQPVLPPTPLPKDEGGCLCVTPTSGSSGGAWWGLGIMVLGFVRPRMRRRGLLLLLAFLGVACGDGDAGLDAGPSDAGQVADVGFLDAEAPWDAGPPPPPTIWAIQQGSIPAGEVVSLDEVIVSSPVAGQGFFISDRTGGAFSGLWVQLDSPDPDLPQVNPGDLVSLTGRVSERTFTEPGGTDSTQTRTELVMSSSGDVRVTGQADLPPPVSLEWVELGLPELAELYEGVVVRVEPAVVTARFVEQGQLALDEVGRLDDLFVTFDLSWIEPGTRFESVTGPLQFEDGQYLIEPRSADDLPLPPPDYGSCLPVSGYTVCLAQTNWPTARVRCAEQGGRLVILETIAKNLEVATLTSTWTDRAFWVGISDQETEGEWVWNDGRPLEYDPWAGGEPNNAGSGEDCAHNNWNARARWNDANCFGRYPYVCEFPDEGPRCEDDAACEAGGGVCVQGSCAKP